MTWGLLNKFMTTTQQEETGPQEPGLPPWALHYLHWPQHWHVWPSHLHEWPGNVQQDPTCKLFLWENCRFWQTCIIMYFQVFLGRKKKIIIYSKPFMCQGPWQTPKTEIWPSYLSATDYKEIKDKMNEGDTEFSFGEKDGASVKPRQMNMQTTTWPPEQQPLEGS